jgi:putative endonuclease
VGPSVLAVTEDRRRTGRAAEQIVAARLVARGWEIVERNARTRYGELDIVARDGASLVFVEVKAGRESANFGPERPAHAIGPRKQRRVRRLATAWLAERRSSTPRYAEIRFDAVGVSFDRDGTIAEIEHLEGAF